MNKKNVFALIGSLLVTLFFAKICLCQENQGKQEKKEEKKEKIDWWSLRENIRTVVGFEQAAASSAQTARKYFFNLFLSVPLPLGLNKDFSNEIGPRFRVWGDIRITSVPQQIQSSIKVFATEFYNKVSDLKVNEVAQGAEFNAGIECFIGTLPQGKKTIHTFSLITSLGCATPLNPRDTVQIFRVTPELKALYASDSSINFSDKDYVAFVKPERDRFYRQYAFGIRIKTYDQPIIDSKNANTTIFKSPAMFDLTFGFNDMATGGRMGMGNLVFRLEGFLPLKITNEITLYLFGTAILKTSHTKISYPIILEEAPSDIKCPAPNVVQIHDPDLNRDYYRIGVGVDFSGLFKGVGKVQKDNN